MFNFISLINPTNLESFIFDAKNDGVIHQNFHRLNQFMLKMGLQSMDVFLKRKLLSSSVHLVLHPLS